VSPELARRAMQDLEDHPPQRSRVPFLTALRAVLDGWAAHAPPSRLTVAFSGGLDSTILLAALRRLDLGLSLRAAHVDHALNPDSARWSEHCAATAAALGVEFVGLRVAVDRASGHGLEAAARDVRYRALQGLLQPAEWLLTAHHADDQLETLLLRMVRGSGVRGLRGIIAFGAFGAGMLARPLLTFTRAELKVEALAAGLTWLEDPSNREARHDRNHLRLSVLPRLLERWPAAARQAERLAAQMHEAESILEAVASDDARPLPAPWCVPRAVLAGLDPARQRNLLRYLTRRAGLGIPGAHKIDELRAALLTSRSESHPLVRWAAGEGRVFRQNLHLLASLPGVSAPDYRAELGRAGWSGPEGVVGFAPARDSIGLPESWLDAGLTLRFRGGGERIRPRGRDHHHSLKHLFQEAGVVPWMRNRIPLLYRGDSLVAVGDLWVSADADAAPVGEPRWRVEWTEHPPAVAPEPR
jgi:tRNA(Ile)-lysidine synthase